MILTEYVTPDALPTCMHVRMVVREWREPEAKLCGGEACMFAELPTGGRVYRCARHGAGLADLGPVGVVEVER